ncbi:MAG: GNAT family N-acetyltransferase [Bacteroidetes bacterium]|nr:GNAT family N-acetyltransferase [Bacteroidota bacterium]
MDIRIFKEGTADYDRALALRDRELRQPLGLRFTTEELKKDEHDWHFGLFDGDEIAACLTLTACDCSRMKMRQVATDSAKQGKGLGRILSHAAEKFAADKGFEVMFCNARKSAVPFYEKLGYKIVSGEFTEVGIPHYTMEKQLTHGQ